MKKCIEKITESPCCKAGIYWCNISLGLIILILLGVGWYFFDLLDLPFSDWLMDLKKEKAQGLFVYFLLTLTAVVIAPVSTMLLPPLAANLWGWQSVFFLSIVAWQIGAIINFWLTRRFGRYILQKFIDLKKVDQFLNRFPQSEQFLNIFLLRMVFPVDILSYALGLTKVNFQVYFWATLFGILPFAFIFSYGGELFDSWEIVPFIAGGILLFWSVKKLLSKKS